MTKEQQGLETRVVDSASKEYAPHAALEGARSYGADTRTLVDGVVSGALTPGDGIDAVRMFARVAFRLAYVHLTQAVVNQARQIGGDA